MEHFPDFWLNSLYKEGFFFSEMDLHGNLGLISCSTGKNSVFKTPNLDFLSKVPLIIINVSKEDHEYSLILFALLNRIFMVDYKK